MIQSFACEHTGMGVQCTFVIGNVELTFHASSMADAWDRVVQFQRDFEIVLVDEDGVARPREDSDG